ncbi:hypothetical protein [Tunicatimonas pelagia]|uniref:hypothetical protein n=1 Tax=Tunicatimonas pelagia TaxID=931531 RepID=UPI0026653870|nr:hypothetical protein [Tunicatimonas pelagia]WKN46193.1 hypothetical protein P0M28_14665 [Tunicatimonas pelagia]
MNTKNWFTTLLGAGVVVSGLALSSCEDEFTEADAIAAQDSTLTALKRLENEQALAENLQQDSLDRVGAIINYNVTVINGGSDNTRARTEGESFASGVTVTLVQGGEPIEVTTNESGVAAFTNLKEGEVAVTIEAADHTTATYTTRLQDFTGDLESTVGTTVPIFPTTVAAGASEISGKVWAETDLTNDTREAATGAVVRATLNVQSVMSLYGNLNRGLADVQTLTYSNFVITDTVDAEGNYTLVVPNGNATDGNGLLGSALTLDFLPFTANQTLVVEQGDSLAVVTREAIFGDGTAFDVDFLPSVSVDIAAPVNSASGFELGTKANRTLLSSFSAVALLNGGQDYASGDILYFGEDADGNKAGFTVGSVDANGSIITLNGIDNDVDATGTNATYSTEPGFDGTDGSGTGAVFDLRFQTTYNIFVTNRGEGYFTTPIVTASAMDYNGSTLVNVADADMASGSNPIASLAGRTIVVDNRIVPSNSNADTIATTGALASAPTLTVMAPEVRKAVIDVTGIGINNNGEITSISFDDNGAGYTSAPTVTINALGGMGTGATGIATIDASGEVSGIVITNGGSGYVENINDIDGPSGSASQNASDSGVPSVANVKPGSAGINKNFNYGTGKRD